MSAGTTSMDSLQGVGFAGSRPAGLPLTRDLAPAYRLSLLVALLMTVASIAGLLYQEVFYPDGELVLSFVPSDGFNLAVGLPLLLVPMWLARRGSLIGLLAWPGALFYVLYMYIPYLIAVPFSVLFPPYILLVALSAYTLIRLVASIDGQAVGQRLAGFVPVRTSAGILLGLALLIIVRQAALILTALTNQIPINRIELSAWIADFAVAVPALLVVGVQMWRHRDRGYVAGAGLFLGYAVLALSVIPFFVLQAHQSASPLDVGGIAAILVMAALCFVPLAFFMRRAASDRSAFHNLNATRVIATTLGVIFGLSGFNHGFFEFLQGNTPTGGLIIQAIGPAQRFWELGTEEAFTILPNFLVSGILSMLVGLAIVVWSLGFIQTKHGRTVFLGLFVLLFLVGGGIGQLAFFIPAWAFATRMDKPLAWWSKVLPRRLWPFLSKLWIIILVLSTFFILTGLEIAIFGYFPGMTDTETIQNTGLTFVLVSALLNILAFIAGFGHDLRRMHQHD